VTVLEVDSSKGEILVQAGIMKLKLKVTDIQRL
jgi:dsDNA-specific endonuclease/ATPase MutS2